MLNREAFDIIHSFERTLYQDIYRAGDGCHREWLARRAPYLSSPARFAQNFSLFHQVMPPTINYENPDPDCDLDYVPNTAREVELSYAISNGMGLGGHNGCVLLGRV